MNVGELSAMLTIDDRQFDRSLNITRGGFGAFAQNIDGDLAKLEQAFSRESQQMLAEIEGAFRRMDPAAQQALNEVAKTTGDGGQRAGEEFTRGIDGKLRDSRGQFVKAGQDAGDGATEGLGRGLGGAKETARKHGQQAGDEFGGGVGSGAESKLGSVGKGMGKGLIAAGGWILAGLAIGQQVMDGVTQAMEQEVSHDLLSAQLGLTADESARAGEVAGKLWADAYGESMGDVDAAIKSVVHNIGGMRDASSADLQAVSAKAMDLSKILDEDVGATSRAVGKMIKTGLAKDATEAFDILTRGAQLGANEAEDLLDTFSEYSTMFRDIGLDGKTAMGLLSQGLQAGARDSDTVADALKEFAIRAQDASDTSINAFKSLGLNGKEMTAVFAKGGPEAAKGLDTVLDRLRNMKDPVERNATAVALFGTKAEDLGDALFALDPSQAVERLGQVEGATKRAGDAMADNAQTKLEQFKRGLQEKLVDFLGGTVIPKVEEFVNKLSLSELPPQMQEAVAKVKELFTSIVEDVRTWVDEHKAEIDRAVEGSRDAFAKMGEAVSAFVDLVKLYWDLFGENMLGKLLNTVENLGQILGGFFDWLSGLFKVVTGFLTGDWGLMWDGLKQMAQGGLDVIRGIVDLSLGNLLSDMGFDWQRMKSDARAKWDEMVGNIRGKVFEILNAPNPLGALGGMFSGWFQGAKDAAIGKLNELLDWVRGLPYRIIESVTGVSLRGSGASLVQGFIDGMQSKIGAAVGSAQELIMRVRNFFPFSPAKVGPMSGRGYTSFSGAALVRDFARGIEGNIPTAVAAAENLLGSLGLSTGALVDVAGARLAGAVAGSAPTVAPAGDPFGGGGDRSLVSIGEFHAHENQTPGDIANDLDWLMRKGGG